MPRAPVKPSPVRQRVKFFRQLGDPHVIPPANHSEQAGLHWLRVRDFDGHDFGLICLQWQPGARRWCQSQQHDTGRDVDVEYYEYVAPCPRPATPEDLQTLREFIADMDEQEQAGPTLTLSVETWDKLRKILYPLIP